MESSQRPPEGPGGEPASPQSPAPSGPPAPGAPPPPETGPQSPSTGGPPATAPSYGGPVPPGGWSQPAAPAAGHGQLASWGTRLGAYLIDGLIILVPAAALLIVFGVGVAETDDDSSGFGALVAGLIVSVLAFVVVSLLYAPLLMKRQGERNGQTWGKQLLNIRAIRTNGQPFTFGSAALREVVLKSLAVGVASSVIPFIPWFLNFFWPLWDDENRALHDMAASTRVVRA